MLLPMEDTRINRIFADPTPEPKHRVAWEKVFALIVLPLTVWCALGTLIAYLVWDL